MMKIVLAVITMLAMCQYNNHVRPPLCLKTSSRIYEPFPSELQSDAVFINPAIFLPERQVSAKSSAP